MKISIKLTKAYEKEISKLLSLIERKEMEREIASDPLAWPVIRGSGGIRKARFARNNQGKRESGRVCYLYIQVDRTIYMLKAYAKNEQADLSEREKKKIKMIVEQIKEIGD